MARKPNSHPATRDSRSHPPFFRDCDCTTLDERPHLESMAELLDPAGAERAKRERRAREGHGAA